MAETFEVGDIVKTPIGMGEINTKDGDIIIISNGNNELIYYNVNLKCQLVCKAADRQDKPKEPPIEKIVKNKVQQMLDEMNLPSGVVLEKVKMPPQCRGFQRFELTVYFDVKHS